MLDDILRNSKFGLQLEEQSDVLLSRFHTNWQYPPQSLLDEIYLEEFCELHVKCLYHVN